MMKFDPIFGVVPSIGYEIEVVQWSKRKDVEVANELVAAGYMPAGIYKSQHDYGCKCNTCRTIGYVATMPVVWKMQYDSSLPQEGAEFISSPWPLVSGLVHQAVDAVSIVGSDAVWRLDLRNRRDDGWASPGFHIHTNIQQPEVSLLSSIKGMHLFFPELISLASTNPGKKMRSLEYRSPQVPFDGMNKTMAHHCFLATSSKNVPHLEWRIFEAEYEDMDYILAATYLCAGMHQVFSNESIFKALQGVGMLDTWPDDLNPQSSTEQAIDYSSKRRLNALFHVVTTCSSLVHMPEAVSILESMFGKAEEYAK